MPARPYVLALLPLDGFRNIGDFYGGFIKIRWEVPNMIKVGRKNRALYMKTYARLWLPAILNRH